MEEFLNSVKMTWKFFSRHLHGTMRAVAYKFQLFFSSGTTGHGEGRHVDTSTKLMTQIGEKHNTQIRCTKRKNTSEILISRHMETHFNP